MGAESTLNGFGEDGAEVLFVFTVCAVANFLAGIEIPIFADGVLSGS